MKQLGAAYQLPVLWRHDRGASRPPRLTLRRKACGTSLFSICCRLRRTGPLPLSLEWSGGSCGVEGQWADRVVGLNGVRVNIAVMRTPDGNGRLELMKFQTPTAVRAEPNNAPANTLGIRRVMIAVEDIEDVLTRLRAHGAELVGELAQYEDKNRLCYVRGLEGVLVALAQQLS